MREPTHQEPLFPRLFLHEDVSPVPLLTAPNEIGMPDSDPIRIGDLRATFDGPDLTPSIEWGDSWTTWKGAVEESFRTEFARVLEYARPLAARVRVAARDVSEPPGADVTFEQPRIVLSQEGAAMAGGHRLRRALTDAVRASGRQPSPFGSLVIDLEHWSATVDALFSGLPPASDEVLAVTYDFLPVLTEWLRADAVAAGGGRHLIRADLGLPAEAETYRGAAALLPSAVRTTLARLAESRSQGQDRLAKQRNVTRVVSALQDDFPRGVGRVQLGIVFAEHPSTSGYIVPAVGLRVPPPGDGYPLRLTDGTVAHLSVPPWTMGWSWDPGGGGKKRPRGWGRRRD